MSNIDLSSVLLNYAVRKFGTAHFIVLETMLAMRLISMVRRSLL